MFSIFLLIILISISHIEQLNSSIHQYHSIEKQEYMLCRKCGGDVADSNYIFTKISHGARTIEKQNLFGKSNVTVQKLVNPYGVNFEIITIEKARCQNIGPKQGADSWFPGYTWNLCTCPHCGQHLGWTFDSITDVNENSIDDTTSFHGLILTNLLAENYSLIMMPKIYNI